jgi:hypothetical protein
MISGVKTSYELRGRRISIIGSVALLSLVAAPVRAADLCNNTNTNAVQNNPASHRTPCHIAAPAHVTELVTYHWNKGHGATPGTITLFLPSTGTQFGPFHAIGTPGSGGAANVNWVAKVDIVVPSGDYQVIDSDVATWSWNTQSQNNGFAIVRGDSGVPAATAMNPNHYHCYAVKQVQTKPRTVGLIDQFQSAHPVTVANPVMLCAPVQKNEEKSPDMTTHLTCYQVEGAKPVNKRVQVTNQFGTQTLDVGDSRMLCVPSLKSLDIGPIPSGPCPSGPNAKGQPIAGLHCPCNFPVDWGTPNVMTTNPNLVNWWASCKPPLQCLGNTPGTNPFGNSSCQ